MMKLKIVSLCVTSKCNLDCIHCREPESKNTEIKIDTLYKLIDELVEIGVKCIGITGGEPFMHQNILELIEYISEKKVMYNFTSNGLISDANIRALKKSKNLNVLAISLDAPEQKLNDYMRGNGSYDMAVDAIKRCISNKIRVCLTTTVFKKNLNTFPKIFDMTANLGVKIHGMRFYIPSGKGEKGKGEFELNTNEYRSFIKYWLKEKKRRINKMILTAEEPLICLINKRECKQCAAGKSYCTILSNGDVTPCAFIPLHVGNINKESLYDIWHKSEILINLRKTNKLKGKCMSCNLNEICGGCRAFAYAKNNDIFGEDPRCWKKEK